MPRSIIVKPPPQKPTKEFYAKPALVDEAELLERKEELKKSVMKFVHSPEQIFNCPTEYNALDRKLIHEIAEELELFHESQGENSKRYLVLKKQQFGKEVIPEGDAQKASGKI